MKVSTRCVGTPFHHRESSTSSVTRLPFPRSWALRYRGRVFSFSPCFCCRAMHATGSRDHSRQLWYLCGTSHATLSETNTVFMHPGVREGQRHAQHSHCTRMFGEAPSFGIHALLRGKEPTRHTHVVVYPERTRPLSVLRCARHSPRTVCHLLDEAPWVSHERADENRVRKASSRGSQRASSGSRKSGGEPYVALVMRPVVRDHKLLPSHTVNLTSTALA